MYPGATYSGIEPPDRSTLYSPVVTSSAAICALSDVLALVKMVKRTVRPPGTAVGNTWSTWPRVVSGRVRTFGSPPAAGTVNRPVDVSDVAKTILPSSPHAAPRGGAATRAITAVGPPVADTFRISRLATVKPIHLLSGDQNGTRAFAVPVTNSTSNRSRWRSAS